jgi:hypothetical protein
MKVHFTVITSQDLQEYSQLPAAYEIEVLSPISNQQLEDRVR